eukprot:scaffold217_cov377-Prasinococcus_capsulatus_cf.AAC.14
MAWTGDDPVSRAVGPRSGEGRLWPTPTHTEAVAGQIDTSGRIDEDSCLRAHPYPVLAARDELSKREGASTHSEPRRQPARVLAYSHYYTPPVRARLPHGRTRAGASRQSLDAASWLREACSPCERALGAASAARHRPAQDEDAEAEAAAASAERAAN